MWKRKGTRGDRGNFGSWWKGRITQPGVGVLASFCFINFTFLLRFQLRVHLLSIVHVVEFHSLLELAS
jgi:hypothetical protein